ncbi:hypothetical protein F8M41_002840 [Gigaspora margarita]|uniref:Uncharacterized protein n=1 Tax=Gigaspora margarita TaxID=4874 RepID=A0A8H3XC72_GIGMA|nr:hypothetical protein F8M41_002840 [Gigaspora margarita]
MNFNLSSWTNILHCISTRFSILFVDLDVSLCSFLQYFIDLYKKYCVRDISVQTFEPMNNIPEHICTLYFLNPESGFKI